MPKTGSMRTYGFVDFVLSGCLSFGVDIIAIHRNASKLDIVGYMRPN